jgi:hypothetical protein
MTDLLEQSPLDIPVMAITRKGEELTTVAKAPGEEVASRVLSDARSEHP